MRSRVSAFLPAFQELGWIEGHNVRIDLRWGHSPERISEQARELQLQPDVIFVTGFPLRLLTAECGDLGAARPLGSAKVNAGW